MAYIGNSRIWQRECLFSVSVLTAAFRPHGDTNSLIYTCGARLHLRWRDACLMGDVCAYIDTAAPPNDRPNGERRWKEEHRRPQGVRVGNDTDERRRDEIASQMDDEDRERHRARAQLLGDS